MADPEGAWLVVGLGNPGPTYSRTRHNAGYLVADLLAARVAGSAGGSASPWRSHKSGRAQVVEGRLGGIPGQPGPRVVLGRARSYMNESGGPVSTLLSFYKVPAERLVIVHDELDIPLGELRVKFGGGDNGHNGLKSLRRSLSTGDYYRVRFGVGRPPGRRPTVDHVLSEFSASERRDLDHHVDRAADAVECLVAEGLARAQNLYNG
ncbi:MAG: aminoacyl-tRNA hydrolase [Actinomycetota bacterium]|nr:aminoacyl-tRNA hydrolase [Actinomycetota bacterium]